MWEEAMKQILSFVIIFSLLGSLNAYAAPVELMPPPEIKSPAAILMEKETGTVIYEKNGR